MLELSVLDLAVVGPGGSAEQALRDVVAVARTAEEYGYHRFWVAEHHAAPNTAGSAPAVLLAYIAGCTRTLRIGSGGVMLPNHSPLVVAEQFTTLQALHDGRVDLGVGRSSGGNTARSALDQALHRHPQAMAEFPHLIDEVIGFLHHSWPPGHRFETLEMSPRIPTPPGLFVLGASENGARIAAERGLPFVYGHHLGRGKARPAAVDVYRKEFRGEHPYLIVSANVLCAETDEQAEHQAMAIALQEIQRQDPTAGQSRQHYLATQALTDTHLIHGDPTTTLTAIHHLADTLTADEIMLVPYARTGPTRTTTLQLLAQSRVTSAVPTPAAVRGAGQ